MFNIFFDVEARGELHRRVPHKANPVPEKDLKLCLLSMEHADWGCAKLVDIHIEEVEQ